MVSIKKLISSIIFVIIIFSFSAAVFANSGPVYWQGYPSSDILLVEEKSPITVKSEDLVFDFSEEVDFNHTIGGKVTANYEMENPTSKSQSVQMAFPFVGSFDTLLPEDITISADDKSLPYDIYIGDIVNSYGGPLQDDKEVSFDFHDIVKTISVKPYKAKNFSENEDGKLYIIDVKPTTDQKINFAIDFDLNSEKTKVITKGFNRYERDDEKTRIAAWCYKPQTLEVYVLGEDIDLNINAYTDGELRKKTDLFKYEILPRQVELKTYLQKFIKDNNDSKSRDMISDTQIYNLYAKSLDENFSLNEGFAIEEDFKSEEYYQRILVLVYTVEFPKNSNKNVSVTYNTSGTMDRTKTTNPLYTFDYILNPAKNWRDFKNLNIKIIPHKKAPHIVKSNIDFTKEKDNVYTATLADLPEEDLSFTLYADEKITLLDKFKGRLQRHLGYFKFFVIPGLIIIGIIVLAVFFIRERINNKRLVE